MAWTDASQAVLKFLTVPPAVDKRYKTLKSLLTAAKLNNTISVTDFQAGQGKKRDLKVVYFAPSCDEELESCNSVDICDGTSKEPTAVPYTLNECYAAPTRSVKFDEIRQVDGQFSFSDAAMLVIKDRLELLRRAINKAAAAKLVAMQGKFPDGSTEKRIALIDHNTGAVRPYGYFEVERALQDAGLTDPIVVGGADTFTWEKGIAIGGLNANGQRIDTLSYGNVFYDPVMNNSFGDATVDHILAYSAQMVKFIAFSHNAGQFANANIQSRVDLDAMFRGGETYLFGVIPDAETGMLYDLDIVMSPCKKLWNITVSITWDIFEMPMMLCNEEDVNGVFHFTVCKPVEIPCPSPSQPLPPTAGNYVATFAADAVPVNITSVTFNGDTIAVGATVTNAVELAAALQNAIPSYHFAANNTNRTVSYIGYSPISIAVTASPTSDNFTLNFTS